MNIIVPPFIPFFFQFSRWYPQHFCPVHPPRPYHHRGHAGQQRHCPAPEHVPGALPVPAAGQLPGGRVSSAFGVRGRCLHFQHPARPGRGAGKHLERQLLRRFAGRALFPV